MIAKKFVFFVLIIFLFSSVSAFTVKNFSIQDSYPAGSAIKGWINISLENEPIGAIVSSSTGGAISLIDLLKKSSNNGFNYTCNPGSCKFDYETSGSPANLKTFNLEEGESALFGFEIFGNPVTNIKEFRLNLSSNNPETEKFPLFIDILDDGTEDWQAYNSTNEFGSENSGCFVRIDTEEGGFGTNVFCEEITLSESPKLIVGAYVTGNSGANFKLNISKIGVSGKTGSCTKSLSGTGIQRMECNPKDSSLKDFSVKRGESGTYLVCITQTSGTSYTIKYERESPCGFSSSAKEIPQDFDIFAQQSKYVPNIKFTLNNEELAKAGSKMTNIETNLTKYILNVYGNNCENGCIIPIKIFAGVTQTIEISGASFGYTSSGVDEYTGMPGTERYDNIYEIGKTNATVSSGFKKLYIDEAGFTAPTAKGNHTFSVSIDGESILSKNIFVSESVNIQSVNPTTTAVRFPTTFKITTTGKNVTGYNWDFGDGFSTSTTANQAVHTYNVSGNYTLRVTANSVQGSSSKNFSIDVAPASEIVPTLAASATFYIDNIKDEIENFSQAEKASIEYALNLTLIEAIVNEINDDLLTAVSESDFEAILTKILVINPPLSIAKTSSTDEILFFPETNNIDINAVKEISGGEYTAGKESQYAEAVSAWYANSITTNMKFSEITLIYDTYDKPLRVFEIRISRTGTDPANLIIKNMEGLFLDNRDSYSEKAGYVYKSLNGETQVILSTTENVDFINLPLFVSPSLDNLVLAEWSPFEETGELKKWILFA
ncbi:MAG: PKD domain-containing protein, partial [Candidatus Pacearchaeota archaeon]|nr:PKD domain-containing protein [Candidatus Pacearchaeota archaeon]